MGLTKSCDRKQKEDSNAKKNAQKNNSNVSDHDMVVLRLKNQRDSIKRQRDSLQKNSDKAAQEAKEFIRLKQKDRAMFCIKRKKLYDNMLTQVNDQYTILEQAIIDVESKLQMKELTKVLEEGNNLIKELDTASQLEKLQDIAHDMKERDENTKQFNKMFDDHHLNDNEIDDLYSQFESEMNGGMAVSTKIEKNVNIMKDSQKNELAMSQSKQSMKASNRYQNKEDEDDQEVEKKLMALA